MSTEDQRRAARAARLGAAERPVQGPAPGPVVQVPGQQPNEAEKGAQRPAEAVAPTYPRTGPGPFIPHPLDTREPVLDDDLPEDATPQDHSPMVEDGITGYVDPQKGDNASGSGDESDDSDTVRHDAGETDGAPRPVIDDGKAAGEAMRRERERRGRAPRTPGHGWLDVDAFTEHLRTARLRPIGSGQATVNVRVSAELADALEKYRAAVEVSKRDVVEALLVELVGPPAAEGGRR